MEPRKRLSDILHNVDREKLNQAWDRTEAAGELGPLPSGEYLCRILAGEASTSKSGTPGYKLTLEVTEGNHVGRRCWHDIWLTPAALPMAKRDLAKIGVVRLEQLDQPLPPGILLRVKLALRQDDDGSERNRVVRFDAAGIEPGDAFAPGEGRPDDQAPTPAPSPLTSTNGTAKHGCKQGSALLPSANGPYAEGY